jgi:O-antigen/teichoic acid export membrane protein
VNNSKADCMALANHPRAAKWSSLRHRFQPLLGSAERKQFSAHVGATLVVRVFLILIGVVTSVMTARLLGPAGRGAFGAAIVLGALGSQFGNLGLHTANTYYYGKDNSLLPRLFSNAVAISGFVGGGIALALFVLFMVCPAWAPVHGELLAAALLLIPATLGQLLLQNLLIGIQQVKWYNIIDITSRAGLVIAMGAAWLVLRKLNPEEVALFALLVTLLTFVICGARLFSITRSFSWPDISLLRMQARYGLRSYITCLGGYAVLKSDILLVKFLAGDAATGYYSLASSMTDFINTFPVVVGMILFPTLAATAQTQVKWNRTRKTMVVIAVVMSFIALASGVLAAPATRLAFGTAFLPAVPPFLILCVAIIFYGANTVVSIFFTSCGQPWFSVAVWPTAAAMNIGLNLFMIPHWGIVGAAISSLITYCVLFVVQYGFALRFVQIAN